MLRIPVAGEPTPPLVAKTGLNIVPVSLPESIQRNREKRQQEAAEGPKAISTAPPDPSTLSKRRRRDGRPDEEPDWEKHAEQRVRVGRKKRPKIGRILAVSLAVLSLVGALLVFMRREKPVLEPIAVAPTPASVPEPVKETALDPIKLPLEMNRTEPELIAELEPIARTFLEAKSIDEMLPVVRDRARVEPKMKAFYKAGVTAPGMSQFNAGGSVAFRGKLAAVSVRTGDFEIKQLAFIRTPEGLKIDWESYVGWSEMEWRDFTAKHPEKPVLFRARLLPVDYYNFAFSSDVEWRSYQLSSPDGETIVYGYAKVGSEIDNKLRPEDPTSVSLVTVKLKYPVGEKQRNQVLIDSVVTDGWVEGMGE
ncbi:MAG TPA: hypothetical protein VM511_07170 [Luteolibacter sp.]|nr:hypothetical protein [Luteolibacter sp.]